MDSFQYKCEDIEEEWLWGVDAYGEIGWCIIYKIIMARLYWCNIEWWFNIWDSAMVKNY
jgi:hypothetical protein